MKYSEIKYKAEKLKWFQCIELPSDDGISYYTHSECDHCNELVANERYAIPLDLKGKSVLDIGANNGYHSFLVERRGAKVTAIEPNQGDGDNILCFLLSKEILQSNVELVKSDLECFSRATDSQFDICFYFGVLYHTENPVKELKYLFKVTRQFAIIETAIAQHDYGNRNVWEFNHGFEGDPTNFFYPSLSGLISVLRYVGFNQVELVWTDNIRVTVVAYK